MSKSGCYSFLTFLHSFLLHRSRSTPSTTIRQSARSTGAMWLGPWGCAVAARA